MTTNTSYDGVDDPATDADDYLRHRQLVLVDAVTPIPHSISSSSSITPTSSNGVHSNTMSRTNRKRKSKRGSKFTLPKGWSVKEIPRRSGDFSDKYYRDPETGRQFRSLKEVERYVTEGVTPSTTRKRLTYHNDVSVEKHTTEGVTPTKANGKLVIYRRKEKATKTSKPMSRASSSGAQMDLEKQKDKQYELAIVSTTPPPAPRFDLPAGWVVEEVPRKSGGSADKYYYEPGTGQKFRSMVAVQKHIAEVEDNAPLSVVLEEIKEKKLPLSKAFKLSTPIKDCGSYSSWKKSKVSRKEKTCPPSKVNWVIAGSGGDEAWNAYVDDTLVPDSVKRQWGNTFVIAINNTKHNTTVSV